MARRRQAAQPAPRRGRWRRRVGQAIGAWAQFLADGRIWPARGGWQLPRDPLGGGGGLKIPQEIVVGSQHQARPPDRERIPVSLQGTPGAKKFASCRTPWPKVDRLRLALAPQFVRRGASVGQQYRAVALGIGADLPRGLGALGALLGGDALPLGLHARQDRLGILRRQVGPADANVLNETPNSCISAFTWSRMLAMIVRGRPTARRAVCGCPARGAGSTRRSN